jgi:hypothetical protein
VSSKGQNKNYASVVHFALNFLLQKDGQNEKQYMECFEKLQVRLKTFHIPKREWWYDLGHNFANLFNYFLSHRHMSFELDTQKAWSIGGSKSDSTLFSSVQGDRDSRQHDVQGGQSIDGNQMPFMLQAYTAPKLVLLPMKKCRP